MGEFQCINGHPNDEGGRFCRHCGEAIEIREPVASSGPFCPNGHSNNQGARFCRHCSEAIVADQSSNPEQTQHLGREVSPVGNISNAPDPSGRPRRTLLAGIVVALLIASGATIVGFALTKHSSDRGIPTSSSGPPALGQQWFAALGIDLCGTMQPNLPASTNSTKVGFTANGNGVLTIQPINNSESGSNATLGKFVSEYKGLELNSSTLQYPGKSAYSDGDVCPKGTPDAGKPGVVIVDIWPNFTAKTATETAGFPGDLLFENGQLITMAFVPATATVPKPSSQAITALIVAETGGSTAPTTATSAD